MTAAQKRDGIIRTILGEAANQGTAGMEAVASVIRNRAISGRYPSDPYDVAFQPSAFSANNPLGSGGNNVGRNADPNSAVYRQAAAAWDGVSSGAIPDRTGGAVNYWAPQGMPGGADPSWASGAQYGRVRIGDQIFLPTHPVPPANIPASPNSSGSPEDRDHVQLPDGFRLTDGQGGPNGLVAADFHSVPPPPRPDPRTGRPTFTIPALSTPLKNSSGSPDDRGSGPIAPIPATRPPGLGTPSSPAPQMATLPTGKSIQVGKNYTIGDKQYVGGVDAHGVGTLTQVKSPLSTATPGTVAGGVVQKALTGALSTVGTNLRDAAGVVGSDVSGLLGNGRDAIAGAAKGAVSGVGGFLSNLFGGGGSSAPPVASLPDPYKPNSGPFSYATPHPPVTPNSSGSPDDRSAPFSPPAPRPAGGSGPNGLSASDFAPPSYTRTADGIAGTVQMAPGARPASVPLPFSYPAPNSSGSPDDRNTPSIWSAPNVAPGNLMDPKIAAISPANRPSMAPAPKSTNSSGSPDDRSSAPFSYPSISSDRTGFSIPAAPTRPDLPFSYAAPPSSRTIQVANPAYQTWVESAGDAALAAARTARPLGGPDGLSAADFAPPPPPARGPAPPKFITKTVTSPGQTYSGPPSAPPPQPVRLASGSMANVGQTFDAGGYTYRVNADGSTTNVSTGHTYGTPSAPGVNLATLGNENSASVDSHGSGGEAQTRASAEYSSPAAVTARNALHPGQMGEWVSGMPLAWRGTINPAVARVLP